tara:strand:+ start:5703 stop:5939 length:237 start_codon:yes stop_codon:yes gene_type:complete
MSRQVRLEALQLAVAVTKNPAAVVKNAEKFKQYIEQGIVTPVQRKRRKATPYTGDDEGWVNERSGASTKESGNGFEGP